MFIAIAVLIGLKLLGASTTVAIISGIAVGVSFSCFKH